MNAITPTQVLDQDQDLAFSFFTPSLKENELLVLSFQASEALFSLTEVEVELVSKNGAIDLHALIDEPATLTVHHRAEGLRHFSGVIAAASRGNQGQHRTSYRVTILPALHRLQFGSDCRIFQSETTPQIIKKILAEHGIDKVELALSASYEVREYCVQYRETHLAFIERLAAEEGIWYFFKHDKEGEHILCFTDFVGGCPELEAQSELEYNAMPGGAVKGTYCSSFVFREQVRATSFTQRDYTFKNPDYRQEHKHERQEDNGSATNYALYDYPGRYKKDAAGKPFTQVRQEAARTDATAAHGKTNAIHLCVGHRISLTDHPQKDYNIKYLIRKVSHVGMQPGAAQEESGGGPTSFSSQFVFMPARLPYRPAYRVKPMVDGPQIAHVVGPKGEEIYCDEFGRIKISFPWNRYCSKDEKASCWVRVSQNWAGALWGHMAIPRIDQEVIVEFLEGDPDQPIVTGRTYDKPHLTPYKLPDNKTRMTIKSKTHKGDGFNELRFEDEKGEEEVWFHAEKFHNAVIEDDETWHIKNNRHKLVDTNQSESIGANKDIEVSANHREQIGGAMSLKVGAVRKADVGGSDSLQVGGSRMVKVGGSESEKLGGARMVDVGTADHLTVAGMQTSKIGASKTEKVGQDYLIKTGGKQHLDAGSTVYVNAGSQVVVEGGSEICLKVGGNFIKISGAGIQIEGTLVKLNCGGGPSSGSEVSHEAPADPAAPEDPDAYAGPHAERYQRSFKK